MLGSREGSQKGREQRRRREQGGLRAGWFPLQAADVQSVRPSAVPCGGGTGDHVPVQQRLLRERKQHIAPSGRGDATIKKAAGMGHQRRHMAAALRDREYFPEIVINSWRYNAESYCTCAVILRE